MSEYPEDLLLAAIRGDGATRATRATDELATLLRETYRRYVAFHSDHEAAESGTVALWTLHTWVFDVADVTPYLLVTAPTSEAGKSRVFDVARCLVREPMVVVDPSPSSLFRSIAAKQPTVLIDEMDMLAKSQTLRTILNAGISPGTPVIRSKKVGDEWVVEELDVFCPKAFSGHHELKATSNRGHTIALHSAPDTPSQEGRASREVPSEAGDERNSRDS